MQLMYVLYMHCPMKTAGAYVTNVGTYHAHRDIVYTLYTIHTHIRSMHISYIASQHGACCCFSYPDLVCFWTYQSSFKQFLHFASPESAQKRHTVSSNSFAYCLLHAITLEQKVLSKFHTFKIKESLRETCGCRWLQVYCSC